MEGELNFQRKTADRTFFSGMQKNTPFRGRFCSPNDPPHICEPNDAASLIRAAQESAVLR